MCKSDKIGYLLRKACLWNLAPAIPCLLGLFFCSLGPSYCTAQDRRDLLETERLEVLDELRRTPMLEQSSAPQLKEPATARWSKLFAGPDARSGGSLVTVYNGRIIKAGTFRESGGRQTRHIAQWDGSGWYSMDEGFTQIANYGVTDLFVFSGSLFASGHLSLGQYHDRERHSLLRWSGVDWVPEPVPGSADFFASVIIGDFLYAANLPAGNYRKTIYRWGSDGWHRFGPRTSDEPGALIWAMAYDGTSRLALGGKFVEYGALTANNVAIVTLDGTDFAGYEVLGNGLLGLVYALTFYEGDLIAGGHFIEEGPLADRRVARFRGGQWEPMGSGFDLTVYALTVYDDLLLASGSFTTCGTGPIAHLAYWDGNDWQEFAGGLQGPSPALEVRDGVLFAFGGPRELGLPAGAVPLGLWDGRAWREFGRGLEGPVRKLMVHGDRLYAVGSFTLAGYALADRVAAWDGAAWSPVGDGLSARVNTIVEHDAQIVVGGNFPDRSEWIHNNQKGRVARLGGSGFVLLGEGLNDEVLALASVGGTLYAGGEFRESGGAALAHIAAWQGSAWAPLGTGVDGTVHCMAEVGGELAVGGTFAHAGGFPARNIAVWNGGSWKPLGDGLPSRVECLAEFRGRLYAGGLFQSDGLSGVAAWDGTQWLPVGEGIDGFVFGLKVHDEHLLAVGWFSAPGGVQNAIFASWNGATWSYPPDDTDGWVEDVVAYRGQLYFGGRFLRVSTTPSSYLAHLIDPLELGPPTTGPSESRALVVELPRPNPANPGSVVPYSVARDCQVEASVFDARGRLIRSWPAKAVPRGDHRLFWGGDDDHGDSVASGVYWMRLRVGLDQTLRKVVILR